MKKMKKISLHNLSQIELKKREQNLLKGGACACIGICLCLYAGPKENSNDSYYGGSSTNDNESANAGVNGNSNTK